MTSQHLMWLDYLVLAAFLVISLAIGLYHALTGGRQKTTTEFIMANRALGVLPAAISMLVSFQSAIMMLGTSAEMYSYGIQYLVMTNFVFILGPGLAAVFFVPWMHSLRLVSVNEYLSRRYKSKSVHILASVIAMSIGVIYMGVAMYAPSVALESATGFPISASIPIMAIVSVAYTSLGGMRAVIWTDVFQFGIMVVGLAAVLIKGLFEVGGVGKVAQLCSEGGRLVWADWSIDPTVRHTAWTFLIGWTVMFMNLYGLSQSSVQRFSATDSVKKGRMTILLNIPGLVIMNTIACSTGLVVFSYFAASKCDPLENGDIDSRNQLLPYFVTTVFANAPGFAGLFLSTLYGGALSSVSSSLSGCAANLWEDVLKAKLSWLSQTNQALLNRFLVVVFGVLATGMAFVSSVLPGTVMQVAMSLSGSIAGPLCGVFLLGGFTKIGNWKGAMIGCISGLCFNIFLSVGSIYASHNHPTLPPVSTDGCSPLSNSTLWSSWMDNARNQTHDNWDVTDLLTTPQGAGEDGDDLGGFGRFLSISYLWYVPLGIIFTCTIGFLSSLILRDRESEEKMDERLLIPVMRRFLLSKNRVQRESFTTVSHNNNNNNNFSDKCRNGNDIINSEHLIYTKPLLLPSDDRNGHV